MHPKRPASIIFGLLQFLKDKFSILHLKSCFKFIPDEIEQLRMKFGQMLLAREFLVSVVETIIKQGFKCKTPNL